MEEEHGFLKSEASDKPEQSSAPAPVVTPPTKSTHSQTKTTKKPKVLFFQRRVALKDKIIFTQQLEVMTRSGLSIIDALKALRDETENKYFSGEIDQIVLDVGGGSPLSSALAKHPNVFNAIYINLIKSGEQSGQVDVVLKRLSEQLEKDYELTRKVRGALTYPIFVLAAMLIVITIVLVVIIPQLEIIFAEAGVKLPLSTQIVIGLSKAVISYGPFILIALVGLFIGLGQWRKTPSGQHLFDYLLLRIPVIGELLKKSYMARFTRTFASLIASGLPVLDVFKVACGVIGNSLYREEINTMINKVKNGSLVSSAFKESKLFPGVVGQLTTVGERSGSLDDVFESLAGFFDRDVDNITANLSTLLEPFLIVIMGAGIGAIIVSVLQPIYGLVNAI